VSNFVEASLAAELVDVKMVKECSTI
jgi:hypothetical protein